MKLILLIPDGWREVPSSTVTTHGDRQANFTTRQWLPVGPAGIGMKYLGVPVIRKIRAVYRKCASCGGRILEHATDCRHCGACDVEG